MFCNTFMTLLKKLFDQADPRLSDPRCLLHFEIVKVNLSIKDIPVIPVSRP